MRTYLLILLLGITNLLIGQATNRSLPKLKINLKSGISYTSFYGQQPFELVLCTEGCNALEQTTNKTTFAYGATVLKLAKDRHYLGLGYNRYQIKINQILSDLFGGGLLKHDITLKYHSLYAIHQYLVKPYKSNIFWNNIIGLDTTNGTPLTKNWSFFYRTGLELGFHWGDLKLSLNPYFQIGLSPYSKKILSDQQAVMRPFNFGLNFEIPLNFY